LIEIHTNTDLYISLSTLGTQPQGLNRRFALRLHLPDYSPAELAEICERQATLYGLELEAGSKPHIAQLISERYSEEERVQNNGGLAVRITEEAFRRYSV
jgi:Holliday junction resolvasome RuvABC ATP-dependent DNA helicase subunit